MPGSCLKKVFVVVAGVLCLSAGASDETVDLFRAAGGNTNFLQDAIKAGGNVNAVNEDGETPLFRAVRTDSVANVKILLAANAEMNVRSREKKTPMHFAIERDFPEIVTVLLDYGFPLKNFYGPNDEDIFTYAVHCNRLEILKLLLRHRKRPRTPLPFLRMHS